MKFVAGLRCHLCGAVYPPEAVWVCSDCLGPLEVSYDYSAIRGSISRALIESRPRSLWRYRELLPVEEPKTGFNSGAQSAAPTFRMLVPTIIHELEIVPPPGSTDCNGN